MPSTIPSAIFQRVLSVFNSFYICDALLQEKVGA
jgi:hypothetical protein